MATALRHLPALTEWWGLFESGRLEAAFTAIGLPPSLSMGMRLIRAVVRWHEEGVAPERMRAAILAHYDADECAELSDVVDRLCASPNMAGREPTIRQAFLNHRNGWDAGPAFMLIPIVEGVLRPAIQQLTPTTNVRHNKIAPLLLASPMVQTAGRTGGAVLRAVTVYLGERFFKDFYPGNPLDDQVRHPYLHGVILEGTRMETLATFLLLDAIVGLLDLCRERGLLA